MGTDRWKHNRTTSYTPAPHQPPHTQSRVVHTQKRVRHVHTHADTCTHVRHTHKAPKLTSESVFCIRRSAGPLSQSEESNTVFYLFTRPYVESSRCTYLHCQISCSTSYQTRSHSHGRAVIQCTNSNSGKIAFKCICP